MNTTDQINFNQRAAPWLSAGSNVIITNPKMRKPWQWSMPEARQTDALSCSQALPLNAELATFFHGSVLFARQNFLSQSCCGELPRREQQWMLS
jgi:hypothetical protein